MLPGSQLEELCARAHNEVILAAPFIKVSALDRIISKIPDAISLRCVTRWRPEEVIAGVSDLEVWTLLKNRSNTSLSLKSNLHAKYYRSDQQCLIGSANLTLKALGWTKQSNLELLILAQANDSLLRQFEEDLFSNVVEVKQNIFDQLKNTVEELRNQTLNDYPFETWQDIEDNIDANHQVKDDAWIPTLRNPEALYLAYSGRLADLSSASREAALLDLLALSVPSGLSKEAFILYVGYLLLQKPIIHRVDSFLSTPQRFGAVVDLLNHLPCSEACDFDASYSWQTLMRWLRYFLPKHYFLAAPQHSEIFGRVQ